MQNGLYYLALPYKGTQAEQEYRMALSLKAAVGFLRQKIHLFAPLIYVNQIADALELPSIEKRRDFSSVVKRTFPSISLRQSSSREICPYIWGLL